MKKLIICLTVSCCVAILFMHPTTKNNGSSITLSEVESITSCEMPDGYLPDGHCVHNDINMYFCASAQYGNPDCVQ